jgi:hypothetical protein
MDSIEYHRFLNGLVSTLEADPSVLGFIALGSTADDSFRDRWSDHDFWVITSHGAQSRYLDTFSWLPRADDILLAVRHGPSRRTVLYSDTHKAEYAVFDPEEAVSGKIERFRVLIDRGDVRELAESIRLQTHEERASALARPDMLENLCVLLCAACERWERGERLSAQRYIQFSVDAFLDLLVAHKGPGTSHAADVLDARRRLEQMEPELGRELGLIGSMAPAEAGVALIGLARRELRPRAPGLAWEQVSVVEKWLRAAGEAG